MVDIALFALYWRQVIVITILLDWVIKYFDLIEHITQSSLAVDIDPSAYPLLLEQLEETLGHSIIMAVATSTLACYEVTRIYGKPGQIYRIYGVRIVANSGFRMPFYRYVEYTLGCTGWGVFVTVILSVGRTPPIHGSGDVVVFESPHQTHRLGYGAVGTALPVCSFSRPGAATQANPGKGGGDTINRVSRVGHATVKNKPGGKKEPWLLVASLSLHSHSFTARQIMTLYQARMQIEESTRDSKNRYSLGMAKVNRIGQQRRADLLLIVAFAAFLLSFIGVAGKNRPIAKQVRVNSSSKRDPYLVIFLARLLLRQPAFRLLPNQLWQSLTTINPYIKSLLCA